MNLVLDASVCLKWYLADDFPEPDSAIARDLLERVVSGGINLHQPAIWRSEVIAVIARKLPAETAQFVHELCEFVVATNDSAALLARAGSLSTSLNHHLFDTIYHALAIEYGIDLVTADEHYYRKARGLGSIVLLKDWRWKPHGVSEPRIESKAKPRRPRKAKSR